MSEKRRGLGRGLGALIPTGLDTPRSTGDRPVDVFFPDAVKAAAVEAAAVEAAAVEAAATGGSSTAAPAGPPAGASADTTTAQAGEGADEVASAAAEPRSAPVPDADGLLPVPGARFAELPVGAIRPNPRQPRTVFDEDALSELVGSITEVGVLQPVVVRAVDDGYELIMGERRWRATQEAGLETIPAIIRETEDSDLLRDALLENLHRSQLNPLEEAAAYQQLLDDFGCTHEQLATRIHRSRPQISNTLRLLRLPPLVQRRVAAGVLSAGHARALLGLGDGAAIERLAQRIVSEGLSVRAVEEIVSLGGDEAAPTRRQRPRAGIRNEALDELAARLSDRFETRVKVDLGKSRGKLTVEFASVQDLNRILGALAPEDPGVLKG
ncbi:ParB/RepB/Spo0J family partition protein [Cellulomonas phragmiteti]|uniref:Chromosome partitioning protein ParB n=1 Tax=Cellulomonas phragmiteti TaxID=478780 RepID=A0ABQ4DNF3_9CELL|nr:ParB/RepB/Spo0J family partition protein [Cellulomonas phragmiteti]GIG40890.1 chromosome partitioning protein ParB [Cellulomonas phragmiteti]